MEGGRAAQPEFVVNGRVTAHNGAGGDIVGNASLGGGDYAIADFAVSGNSDLSSENHILADFSGTRESCLRAQQRVFADAGAMANLDQIIDFCSGRNIGFANAGTIHASVRLHFDVVAQDCRPGLHDLVPVAGIIFGEAKAVGANDHAVLQNDIVTNTAMFPHDSMSVGEEIVTDACPSIDHNMGEQNGIVADDGALINHNVGTEMGIRADLC